MNQNPFSPPRRGGFLTIGLILCMIVALTAAGVLWNYQYLTIQSVEMECAARSAIQASINDGSIETVLALTDGGEVSDTTLDKVLARTYNQQKSGNVPTVKMYNQMNRILEFSQHHKLGVFSGTIEESKRTEIEGKSFTQYYQIHGSSGSRTFNKYTN